MVRIDELLQTKPFGVVAHRGGGQEATENTIEGIEYALKTKADIIEVDIRSTKDGELILLHDPDFIRVAGVDKSPKDLDLASIRENILIADKEPIATLQEALEAVNGKTGMFLEIKEPETTERVLDLIEQYDARSWCAVISFYDEVIVKTKQRIPELTTGLVYSKPPGRIKEAADMGADFVLPHERLATIKANRFAHSLGLPVVAWTINEELAIAEAIRRGVDCVATDYPKKAVKLKKRIQKGGVVYKERPYLELIETKSGMLLYKIVLDEDHFFLEQNFLKKSKYGVAYEKLREKSPNFVMFWEIKENDYTGRMLLANILNKRQIDGFLEDLIGEEFKRYEDIKDELDI